MTERWLPMPGAEGRYKISDQGRIKSLSREVVNSATGRVTASLRERICLTHLNKRRQLVFSYRSAPNDGPSRHVTVHVARIVYDLFVERIPEPRNEYCVRHHDGDRANCEVSNLYLQTLEDFYRETRG